jgi:hypothetical protein
MYLFVPLFGQHGRPCWWCVKSRHLLATAARDAPAQNNYFPHFRQVQYNGRQRRRNEDGHY